MFQDGVHAKYRTRKVLNTDSLLVNVGRGTFHFSTRVVGIFNIGLHHTNDDVCPMSR
jgi:hypothetical protein